MITEREISTWPKPDNTPLNNAKQCSKELEKLIIHLVKDDIRASLNKTAKDASIITGNSVSANLVKGVRKRNNLNPKGEPKKLGTIRSSYEHTVSIDVLRENGNHIYGFIRDKNKFIYHHSALEHNSKEALTGLENYIRLYGKPEAVRTDNGSEFKGEFEEFIKSENIKHLKPLPYNPKANGFIERYFRTLRKDVLRKLKNENIKITQYLLDEVSFLWNHCRRIKGEGKTPGEMAGIKMPDEMLKRFEIKKETIATWNFWHIKGVKGLLHAYLRMDMLDLDDVNKAA